MAEVVKEGADLGIAWDGDADRCFFVDEHGGFADSDFACALLARQVLAAHPGAEILYDVRSSRAIADTVRAAGGRPVANRVGHAFFKARMHEQGGAFGGEVSGHYYFADFHNAGLGDAARPAHAGAARPHGPHARRAAGPVPVALLHLGRGQLRGGRPGGEAGRDPRALRRRGAVRARRHLRRLRRLALQRPRRQHRAAAAPVPGEPRLAGAHGGQARRGAGRHPRPEPAASADRVDVGDVRAVVVRARTARPRTTRRAPRPAPPRTSCAGRWPARSRRSSAGRPRRWRRRRTARRGSPAPCSRRSTRPCPSSSRRCPARRGRRPRRARRPPRPTPSRGGRPRPARRAAAARGRAGGSPPRRRPRRVSSAAMAMRIPDHPISTSRAEVSSTAAPAPRSCRQDRRVRRGSAWRPPRHPVSGSQSSSRQRRPGRRAGRRSSSRGPRDRPGSCWPARARGRACAAAAGGRRSRR